MKIEIRPYQKTDKEACIAAFLTNTPKYFTEKESQDYGPWLDEKAFAPNLHYYVLTCDNKVVACGGFVYQQEDNQVIFVWGLVDRAQHRNGFGKRLVEFRLREINKLYPGVPVRLDTTQFSFPFFQKLGFTIDKITSNYYAPGYDRYDMTLANSAE